jgi:2-polyprenyl-3-methyl-5-hydroxy-6-metoxy-1,4-benzoquinol methylase
MPLVLPVHVVCNTDDDVLNENIRVNSRRAGKWLEQSEAHNGVAVLCGSGPSLADTLPEIRKRCAEGAKLFAMNGAAAFLAANELLPDYQVILDARPETADLVGTARQHLFASQCAPETFDRAPNPILWHMQIEGIDDLIPDYDDGFAMIGGAASVGNTATCLAYAMGFREIHCYGYDSSYRDDHGHAFPQAMNDGEPCAMVPWRGKHYRVSLTMKLQAEKFQGTAKALKDLGCKIEVHGSGLLPDIYNAAPTGLSEREKYEAMWAVPQYRIVAPGEDHSPEFIHRCYIDSKTRVIDFGAGTGRGSLAISKTGADVVLVDFASNARDPEASHLPFVQADLSQPMLVRGDYGYCADVMEHIPPEQVDAVLTNIMACVPGCFFVIDFCDDLCGAYIGEALHLSVHPYQWWLDTFMRLGMGVEFSRDEGSRGVFNVTRRAYEIIAAE